MTLIFSTVKPTTVRGQAHALVVGVNEYPHLLDGTAFARLPAAATLGLGQLTSPIQSAQEFTAWLRDTYANDVAPLGSVEVLLSPPPVGIEAATMSNVKSAFDRWLHRCDQSNENLTVFYFCGHGVEAEVLALLTEDFGSSPNRLWENAIDFDGTLDGMAECKARSQCYFIDCCRDTPIEALRQLGRLSAPPLKTVVAGYCPPREAAVYLAAPIGKQAHAPVAGVSYFTHAVLNCLGRCGARGHDGTNWVVSTDSLKTALKARMRRTRVNGARLACDTGRGVGNLGAIDLHGWPGPAHVMAEVIGHPPDTLEYADLYMRSTSGLCLSRQAQADPWELELDCDDTIHYDLLATLVPGAPYGSVSGFVGRNLYPPFQTFLLRATR